MKYVFFLSILCYSISFAQFGKGPDSFEARPSSPVILEAIPYRSVDSAAIELIVLFRVSQSFLIFTKSNNVQQDYYEAKGELIIEITDSSNITVERGYRPMRILRNSLPADDALPTDEIQGIFTFKLKNGFYKISAEVKDNGSGKSFLNRDIKIDARTFSAPALHISPIMFIDPIKPDSYLPGRDIFFPINHGGNVIIGQSGTCVFQVISPDTITGISLEWKIQRKNEDQDEILQESQGEYYTQRNGILSVIENTKQVSFTIINGSGRSRFIFVPVPVERLETGTYSISMQLTQGVLKLEKESKFKVIWPLRPFSLSDPKLAVDALKLIAAEEEINEMSSLDSDESRKVFQSFWRKRSPDTTRAYNSVMAEYYRRVDESIKRYSTANEKDGYRTDRGRIYMLFGAPTIVNRLLKPNTVPAEIWTYEKLKKRFTFRDLKKNGNYILVKTENN